MAGSEVGLRDIASFKSGKIRNLEVGRAIAAFLVILYHVDKFYFGTEKYWPNSVFGHYFTFGHAGVEFFFVLSGFIMFLIHQDDIGKPGAAFRFAKKRLLRIYPFYWVCLAATILLFLLFPAFGLAKNRDIGNIVGSIALFGINPFNAVIFVSWTLFHETLFYAIFAAIIIRPRLGWPLFGAWMLGCGSTWSAAAAVFYPLSLMNILFALGIASAFLVRHHRIAMPGTMLIAGVALFFTTGFDEAFTHRLSAELLVVAYGVFSAIALTGAVVLEREGRLRAPASLVLCGQASFAIYLTHMLALALFAKALKAIGAPHFMAESIAFVALTTAAVLLGISVHLLVERPLLRVMRRAFQSRGGPSAS